MFKLKTSIFLLVTLNIAFANPTKIKSKDDQFYCNPVAFFLYDRSSIQNLDVDRNEVLWQQGLEVNETFNYYRPTYGEIKTFELPFCFTDRSFEVYQDNGSGGKTNNTCLINILPEFLIKPQIFITCNGNLQAEYNERIPDSPRPDFEEALFFTNVGSTSSTMTITNNTTLSIQVHDMAGFNLDPGQSADVNINDSDTFWANLNGADICSWSGFSPSFRPKGLIFEKINGDSSYSCHYSY